MIIPIFIRSTEEYDDWYFPLSKEDELELKILAICIAIAIIVAIIVFVSGVILSKHSQNLFLNSCPDWLFFRKISLTCYLVPSFLPILGLPIGLLINFQRQHNYHLSLIIISTFISTIGLFLISVATMAYLMF